ncbi:unnamed protein product, partial [Mesorhabditis belari]|uniref:Uncharacterized protein n=1 Tax=Mesorhabditis belari TaxID=2138241 RepID=A0AAF3EXL3_9BILA
MVKLPLPLPNLRNSPMDKLCYDLKLEIFERMDLKDVIELMKNKTKLSRMFDLRFEIPSSKRFVTVRTFLILHVDYSLTDKKTKMISGMLECLASVQEIRPVKDYEALCKYLLIFKGSILSDEPNPKQDQQLQDLVERTW